MTRGLFIQMAERRRRANRDRGAGLVEYIGLLLIMGVALAVGVGTGAGALNEGGLVQEARYGVCVGLSKAVKNVGIDLEDACKDAQPKPENLPPCITYQQDRLISGNIDFRFIRGELTGKDQIFDLVDPATGEESAYVILGNEGGIGLEGTTGTGAKGFGKFLSDKGVTASGKVALQSGTGVVYKFDSHDEAQQFLDDHRGNTFQRVLGAIPGASTVEGLYQGAKDLLGLGGGDDSDDPAPSGAVANLSLQAEGSVNYQGNSIPGVKGNNLGLQGEIKAGGKASGQIRYNFDGTSQLLVRYEGDIGLEGGAGVSRDLAKKYPWLGNLGITGGHEFNGAVQYRIRFDEDFNPTQFELRTETGQAWTGKAGNTETNTGIKDGEVKVNTYTLDLTDPENRDAVLETLPWVAAGNLASPAAPVGILATDNPLSRRLTENSIQYEQIYDTEGDITAASSPDSSREGGLKIGGFGFGGNNETAKRTLKSARYIDHSQPGATWQELEHCTG